MLNSSILFLSHGFSVQSVMLGSCPALLFPRIGSKSQLVLWLKFISLYECSLHVFCFWTNAEHWDNSCLAMTHSDLSKPKTTRCCHFGSNDHVLHTLFTTVVFFFCASDLLFSTYNLRHYNNCVYSASIKASFCLYLPFPQYGMHFIDCCCLWLCSLSLSHQYTCPDTSTFASSASQSSRFFPCASFYLLNQTWTCVFPKTIMETMLEVHLTRLTLSQ